MLLSEVFPELSKELQGLLHGGGEAELAEQVPLLNILDRCRCGDDFCATIYTQPPPVGRYGPNHRTIRTIDLDAENGMIIVDVVSKEIACIEILNRDEIRKKLLEVLP